MLNNSRKPTPNGVPGSTSPPHRIPVVADQPLPSGEGQPCHPDEQTEQMPDLRAFKVFMKRNLPYQDLPEGAMADLRARIVKLRSE